MEFLQYLVTRPDELEVGRVAAAASPARGLLGGVSHQPRGLFYADVKIILRNLSYSFSRTILNFNKL
jgi:hypothetical protein